MKPLDKMDNLDRAYLLAQLFPEELQKLTAFIKAEAELFIKNKEYVFDQWDKGIITANFWYMLIGNFERSYRSNGTRLYKNKKTFSDHLFDGYNALFAIHALIHYTEQEECPAQLCLAIHFLFGTEKLVLIDLNTQL